jgi:hypothetical protein
VIYFSSVLMGPELARSPISDVIRRIAVARGPGREGDYGSLDVVFHVPGSILRPKFEGVRTSSFFKRDRIHMIQIAIPEEQVNAPDLDYLMSSIRQAIRLARPRFEKAGIKYPEEEYLATVDRIERELKH